MVQTKKVYRTKKEAVVACKPYQYAKKTLPWAKQKGYICAKKTYWMEGYKHRPREKKKWLKRR